MDAGEIILLLISVVAITATWLRWAWVRASVGGLRVHERPLYLVATAGTISLVIAALVVWRGASISHVRALGEHMVINMAAATGMIGLAAELAGLRGVSLRAMVLEHHNPAGTRMIACSFFAFTLPVVAPHLSYQPMLWSGIFSGALALIALMAAWQAADSFTHLSDRVCEARNVNAGIRGGCLLIALGLVTAWAILGKWVDFYATVQHFGVRLAATVVMVAIASFMERSHKHSRRRGEQGSRGRHGYIPGAVYLFSSVVLTGVGEWLNPTIWN